MLNDGGKVYLSCSSCAKELVEVWVTRPEDPAEWTLIANCPYCGDRSLRTKIRGRFHLAGVGVTNPEDPEDARVVTSVVSMQDDGDVIRIQVKEARHG